MMTPRILAGAAALSAFLLGVSPLAAKELVYGTSLGANHGVTAQALAPFVAEIGKATKGSLTFKIVADGQLVTLKTAATGITKRTVDAGLVVPASDRKTYPNSAVLVDMQGFSSDTVAVAGAALETAMLNCPECLAEWKKANQVLLSNAAATPYMIMCKDEVPGADWFGGKKILVSGATSRFAKVLGAVPVTLAPEDGKLALSRGTVDCAIGAVSWLASYGYKDVVKQVIEFPLGSVGMIGLMVVNRDAWNGLSPDQRKAIVQLQPTAAARATVFGYIKDDEVTRKLAIDAGVTFKRIDMGAQMKVYLANEETFIPKLGREMGSKNPEQVMAAYRKALSKWEKLSPEIGTDVDKLAAALKTHIYDRLDPSKL